MLTRLSRYTAAATLGWAICTSFVFADYRAPRPDHADTLYYDYDQGWYHELISQNDTAEYFDEEDGPLLENQTYDALSGTTDMFRVTAVAPKIRTDINIFDEEWETEGLADPAFSIHSTLYTGPGSVTRTEIMWEDPAYIVSFYPAYNYWSYEYIPIYDGGFFGNFSAVRARQISSWSATIPLEMDVLLPNTTEPMLFEDSWIYYEYLNESNGIFKIIPYM